MDVVAAGKAAEAMFNAFAWSSKVRVRRALIIAPGPGHTVPGAEWIQGGHPLPSADSVTAAGRALQIAHAADARDLLVVLLSGGASALMALPADDLSLEDKHLTIRTLLDAGADIHELNTVRKHLSSIKGGQLAAANAGHTLALIVSDVVGDDPSVIASGPTVADRSTFQRAMEVLDRWHERSSYPPRVVERLLNGIAGSIAETPKPGDSRMARSTAHIIGGRIVAMKAARNMAESLGYRVQVFDDPIVGEARVAGRTHLTRVDHLASSIGRPLCVVSSGETTVRVRGRGKGGRNQELALAMVRPLASRGGSRVAASIGTDGIDGPTDAAGALVDSATMARAQAAGLAEPERYLDDNNAYAFFAALGDLVRTGATNTNVGDLQVVVIDS
jgi:glycerate 2-kinase